MINYLDILELHVSDINLDVACQEILRWVETRSKQYVCVAPVSTVVDCQRDPEYKKIVNSAGMITPDGMPLVWLGRWKGSKTISRTYGPDLMQTVCERGQKQGLRHFFYGGCQESVEKLIEKLKTQYSDIHIAGYYVPPHIGKSDIEADEILERINHVQPDVLWVGLGSPKQDYWMCHHRSKLEVPVMIGVGAAFDFLSGRKRQAPRWIQRSGLEWLFRFCCEPRRLWRRYLVGNSLFIYWLFKQAIKTRFQKNVA